MKKFILAVLMLLTILMVSPAFAGEYETIDALSSTSSTDIACATTSTVYSKWFALGPAEYFGVSYKYYASDGNIGTMTITIQLEQSFQKPTTDGSADASYYSIPVNMSDIVTAGTAYNTWAHKSISPIPLGYARFKITGTGSNDAHTVVNVKLHRQLY